jgi:hypothetical protein
VDLVTGLRRTSVVGDDQYPALMGEFLSRHAHWLKGRCSHLAWRYWRGDSDFAEELFARFSEKLARRGAFAGLKEPAKWQGFLGVELDHQAQDLGRFLRAARRDRRHDDGTKREVQIDHAPDLTATLTQPDARDLIVARENVEAVKHVIQELIRRGVEAGASQSARDLYSLQMFVRVILQGHARKDLAIEQMTTANAAADRAPMSLDAARKKVERGVIGGVTAIAAALLARGHTELAASFRDYLQEQAGIRGRAIPFSNTTHARGERQ